MKSLKPLNIITALTGIAIVFLGLNIGLGGIHTLGWQGARDFITVTNAPAFGVQDSHIRFLGGLWFGVGIAFLAGSFWLAALRPTLAILCAMIAAAGLFRLSDLRGDILLGSDIAPSLALELIGFPLLAIWLLRSGRATPRKEKPLSS